MTQPLLANLIVAAAAADGPGFTPKSTPDFGGVDPLGLRQINFDLMDQVLPGLNNIARHIKPFVVVAWAWRRAWQCAEALGPQIDPELLRDFVDRIEVIYVWSQMLKDPSVDLPGRQVLAPLLRRGEFKFGGPDWETRRRVRRYSTALSAPINYGPGLKMLGWVQSNTYDPTVMNPNPAATPALDALEAQIGDMLNHEAFSSFDPVVVTTDEARVWADSWAMDNVAAAEARVMIELLVGSAPVSRRLCIELMQSAAAHTLNISPDSLRAAMSGPPSKFMPAAQLLEISEAWRRLQIRQLFRFSLEALFYWMLNNLQDGPRSIDALVTAFLNQTSRSDIVIAREWIDWFSSLGAGPTELTTRLQEALRAPTNDELARSIATGLCFCLTEISSANSHGQQTDRLPLDRAQREAGARASGSVEDLIRHVLESWVLAQHAYWAVGRGLADARARGRALLRLKIILDEGGWGIFPGAPRALSPEPTRDRLQTAVSLATECGLL